MQRRVHINVNVYLRVRARVCASVCMCVCNLCIHVQECQECSDMFFGHDLPAVNHALKKCLINQKPLQYRLSCAAHEPNSVRCGLRSLSARLVCVEKGPEEWGRRIGSGSLL